MTTTKISPSPYELAIDTLREFLNYANTVGADVVVTISLTNNDPKEKKSATDERAEVTPLQRVGAGWLLYIKLVGNKKGSYALRADMSTVVFPLTVDKLQSNHFNAVPKVAEIVKAIMNSPSPLNT